MHIKLSHGFEVDIDLSNFADNLTREQKREIADSLAIDDDIIDLVAQQIIDRWTEFDSHGAVGSAEAVETRGLGKAWRDVAKASGDVAKREIERLETSLAASERQVEEYRERLYRPFTNNY